MTEECFKKTQLDFVGDIQWVMYQGDQNRVEVPAQRTREGTFPEGSQWTRNPLDASSLVEEHYRHGHVIDIIEVPEGLEPGKYVLSFRWDCQKTPQVWNLCANVDIL